MGSGVGIRAAPPQAEPRRRLSRDHALALVTVLVVAAGTVLRLRAVLAAPGVLYPDETYQMTEAAHRVVFGYGITPWEFQQGLRSWLGPGLLLPPTALGGVLGLDGLHLTMLVRVWVVLGSAVGAGAAAVAARRLAGPVAGLLAAALVAFSPALAVYDVHPLADTVAAPLPVLALALLLTRSRRELPASVAAGGLLAAAVALRPQAGALVLGLVAAVVLGRSRPRVLGLLAGLAGGALLTGVLDLLTWGVPFAPEWRSVAFNVVEGGADTWGRERATFYADHVAQVLGPLPIAVVVLGLAVALLPFGDPVTAPVPTWPVVLGVLGFVGVLSLIGHKELRFVLPALPIASALAAAGVVRAVRRPAVSASAAVAVAVAGAVVMPGIRMSDLGYPGDPRSAWTIDPATPRLLSVAGSLPEVCGVALVSERLTWSGGYSALHRDVPLGQVRVPSGVAGYPAWADAVVVGAGRPLPAQYRVVAAAGASLLAVRDGGCAPAPAGVRARVLPRPPLTAPLTSPRGSAPPPGRSASRG